jgi:hypothetical protein
MSSMSISCTSCRLWPSPHDPDASGIEKGLAALRNAPQPFSFRRFQETSCLDPARIETLVAVLDVRRGATDGMRPMQASAKPLLKFFLEYFFEKIFQSTYSVIR